MISTDYTKATDSTLCGAAITRYRFSHWLCDILKNFMSDPLNIKDDRLARLLFIQDGPGKDDCRALFQVALPYSPDSRKAGTTPAVLVSVGTVSYPVPTVMDNYKQGGFSSATSVHSRIRTITGKVAIVTESVDGTNLFSDEIETFLVHNQRALQADGMLSYLNIKGSSEPQEIKTGEGSNAKPLYQVVIELSATGATEWTADMQGPLFRGTRSTISVIPAPVS